MANQPKARKRVQAMRRAPDGSAFQKCEKCGVSVAVALEDMHECEPRRDVKRFTGFCGSRNRKVPRQSVDDLPRSPFCFFMESFSKEYKTEDFIEMDRKGFEAWRNMSEEERKPYIIQADKVDSAYQRALLEEVNDMIKIDDEADSSMAGKFNKSHQCSKDYDTSAGDYCCWASGFESFNTHERFANREMVKMWNFGSSESD